MTFLVGTDPPARFIVHEDVVKPRSELARLALQGEWKGGRFRVIPLPDDDPAVFSIYQQWLYSGLIHTDDCKTTSGQVGEYKTLVKSYILGEKIMDCGFKNTVADAIVEKVRFKHEFDKRLTSLVFENTPPGSPLRSLFLDIYCHFGTTEWLDSETAGNTISAEFAIEFNQHQMRHRTGFGALGRDAMFLSCTYHSHGTASCYRSRLR